MANEAQKEPTMEEILASIRKIISDDDTTPAPAESKPHVVEEPVAAVNDDAFEELRFEPGEGELDDSMFEDSSEPAGFGAQEEADPFGDSDFVVADASIETAVDSFEPLSAVEETVTPEPVVFEAPQFDEPEVHLEVVAEIEPEAPVVPVLAEIAAVEEESVEDEDVSFEEMLGAVNKVAEDFDAVSGEMDTEIDVAVAQPEPTIAPLEAKMSAMPSSQPAGLTDAATAGAAAGSLGKLFSTMEMGSDNTIDGLVRELLKPMIKEWLDANLASIVEQKVEAEVQRIANMAR